LKGYISNIQRFSLHDGPGIRTTIFLAGCNLRCYWCHNPEALEISMRLQFFKSRCTACGECVKVCANGAQQFENGFRFYESNKCCLCGKCKQACYFDALRYSCCKVGDNEVIEEILKDKIFYGNSGGGVTFSGGEPFLQPEFLRSLLEKCKELKIGTVVETAGNVDYKIIYELLPFIDVIICDMKAFDRELHIKGTGAYNNRIIENIKKLSQDAKELWVRIPIVPGYNDNNLELCQIAAFLKTILPSCVELMPFHRMGKSKYESLSLPYAAAMLAPPSEDEMASYINMFSSYGLNIKNKSY
jgi:pyruvate formate lyase activating enzyme